MHRLTEFSLKRPWLTLAILLAITAFLGMGVPKVKPAYGFRVLIGENHPAIQALDSLVGEFAGGYPAGIAWECGKGLPCERVFDEESLQMAQSLTNELSSSPVIVNVLGPSNASILMPSDNGFIVRRFVENGVIAADLQALSERVSEDPLWVSNLVSKDQQVGLIIVQPMDNRPETDLLLAEAI
ncbi:hypothetical protein MK280_05145, partial [Myxococcota bacterium]|nr:hypothetical protein [Myxococcota bacterium]